VGAMGAAAVATIRWCKGTEFGLNLDARQPSAQVQSASTAKSASTAQLAYKGGGT